METALHNAVYSVYTVHDAVTDVMIECTYSYCMMSYLLLYTEWKETHRRCQSQWSLGHCPSAGEKKQVELDNNYYSHRIIIMLKIYLYFIIIPTMSHTLFSHVYIIYTEQPVTLCNDE